VPSFPRRLLIAAALLGGLWLLTLVPWRRGSQAPSGMPKDPVKLRIGGDASGVTLEKKDGAWRLTDPLDWPADTLASARVLDGLRRLSFEAEVTRRPESHAQYDLSDDKALRLQVWGAGEAKPFSFLLGKQAGMSGRSYARLDGDPVVRLADGPARGEADLPLTQWRDRRLLYRGDLSRVEVSGVKKPFVLAQSSAGWTVDGAPADEKKAGAFVSALRTLAADGFIDPPSSPDLKALGLLKPAVYAVSFSSGPAVVLSAGAGDPRAFRREGAETLFLVPAYRAARLDVSPDDLRTPSK
jgi:hypothetical protein